VSSIGAERVDERGIGGGLSCFLFFPNGRRILSLECLGGGSFSLSEFPVEERDLEAGWRGTSSGDGEADRRKVAGGEDGILPEGAALSGDVGGEATGNGVC
jgi:hypothetical protein